MLLSAQQHHDAHHTDARRQQLHNAFLSNISAVAKYVRRRCFASAAVYSSV